MVDRKVDDDPELTKPVKALEVGFFVFRHLFGYKNRKRYNVCCTFYFILKSMLIHMARFNEFNL